ARLRAGRDAHADAPVEHGDLHLRPERRLDGRDGQVDREHVALAPEHGVRAHARDDVQVARRAAAAPGRALARHALGRAARRAGRDLHAVAALAVDQPRAAARLARHARNLPRAAAAEALAAPREEPHL